MSVKIYEAKASGTFDEWGERAGSLIQNSEIDHIIDYDCDAYDSDGNPLFMFRKNVIPKALCKQAYGILRHAATPTNNRGNAAGEFTVGEDKTLEGYSGVVGAGNKQKRFQTVTKDGYVSKTLRAKTVKSGIIGYFDRTVRFPYCRQTAWTEKNFDQFRGAYPYIKHISDQFREACPERWSAQNEMAQKTNADFLIGDTVFTTVTVNKNFRTAIHTDAGDFKGGFGNIAVLQAGKFEGGYTCLPRYRVGFDVRNTDICFFNVHEWHGNLEVKAKQPYERISIVSYYRENMFRCGTADQELDIIKNRKDLTGLNSEIS